MRSLKTKRSTYSFPPTTLKNVLLKERIEVKSLGNFSSMFTFIINSSLKPFTFTGDAQSQYTLRKKNIKKI